MTTFTTAAFQGALKDLAQIADTQLSKAVIQEVGQRAITILVAASATSGGVKAPRSQFKVKGPSNRNGSTSASIVGWGFAVLDEEGSWHKPSGWDIYPRKSGARQRNAKKAGIEARARAHARSLGYSKVMLGNRATGFAAAYAHHKYLEPHPFQDAAEPLIFILVEKATDLETLKALAKVGLG